MTDDPIQALVSGVLDRVRGQLQQELTGLVDGLHAHTAEARATAAQAARAEAESAAAALASGAIAAERSAFEGRLAAARAEARDRRWPRHAATSASPTWRAPTACWRRCVRSTTRPPSATRSTRSHAPRTSKPAAPSSLLVRGDQLRGWAQAGFDAVVPGRACADPAAGRRGPAGHRRVHWRAGVVRPTARRQAPAPLTLDGADRQGIAAPVIGRRTRRRSGVRRRRRGCDARGAQRVARTHRAAGAPCLAVPRGVDRAAVRARADRRRGRRPRRRARRRVGADATRGCWCPRSSSITRRSWTKGRRHGDLRRGSDAQITRARQLYEQRVPPRVRTQSRFLRGRAGAHAGRRRRGAAGAGFVTQRGAPCGAWD